MGIVVDRMAPGYEGALDCWPALFARLAGEDWARIGRLEVKYEVCADEVKMQFFDRCNPPHIPLEVAVCPICGAELVIDEIDEYEVDTGRVTECGLRINCSTEPDIDSDDWWPWHNRHWSTPYIDWLPIHTRVYRWFDKEYRVCEGNTIRHDERR